MKSKDEMYAEYAALVVRQLNNFFPEVDEQIIEEAVPGAFQEIERCFTGLPSARYWKDGRTVFSPFFSIHWMLFLYRLAHAIYIKRGAVREADQVYYLNKIMHSNDWFYAIDLPTHFLCEHPLGSILGRAQYGDYLFVYQGTTIGGNRSGGVLKYPTIGDRVILYANATVLGDSQIGSNVVISADTYIINQTIPDNCLVFGKSPNLIIKRKTREEMGKYFEDIWG